MIKSFQEFRKTIIYDYITVILLMAGSYLFYYECQRFVFKDRPFQIINNMKLHPFIKEIIVNNNANQFTYLLNKDGTLTVHRLSDGKNFIVKLDKGEK